MSAKVVIRRRPQAREGRFNPQEEKLELAVHQNKIINTFDRIGSREKERASDAGEDREEIGSLIELTGLNKKAVAFARMLHKQEPDKREDILRSLRPLLDLMEAHWQGQSTPDMFTDAVEPDEAPAFDRSPEYDGDDEDLAEDTDDFLNHLAEVEATAE